MGHAVYSLSDPRERIFSKYVEKLAYEKGKEKDLELYRNVEELAPQQIAKYRRIYKGVSPNVDFYSGFVYDMRTICPASCPMNVLPKCPSGMRQSRQSWQRK